MNGPRTLRHAALVIFLCSAWGCSKPNGPVEHGPAQAASARPATAQQDRVATTESKSFASDTAASDTAASDTAASDTAASDTVAQPVQFPTAPAAFTDIDPPADAARTDSLPNEESSDLTLSDGRSVTQVSATQVQPGPGTPATPPPTQTDLSNPGGTALPAKITGDGPTTQAQAGHAGAAQREPLFVNWPKPQLAMLLTGRQYGYLEPCGCSGLENQNGGLVRRSTLIKQLTAKGWPLIPIDAGNQVRRFGRQAEIKFQITAAGLRTMGYQVIGFGPDDLRLPGPELVGVIAPNGDEPSLFVSANVEVFDPSFSSPYRVIEKGGKKIGITAVLGERNQKMIHNDDVNMQPAEMGLKRVWPQLEQAKCDLYVLIAHATTEESIALGQAFPQFKVVITTGGAGEPMRVPDKIQGTDSLLVEVGTKGMYAGVVALFDDPANPLRYQRIPLDSRFPDSKDMLQLLAAYQDQLKAAGFEGLGIRPQPVASGLEYVGSKVCEECHEDEYKIWSEGLQGEEPKHSHAYATLQHPPNSRGSIPRNFDPECISCHVVGWNPQKYFPYNTGFLSLEKTPQLTGVGCENCHGPGSKHVAAENGDLDIDDDEIEAIRDQAWLDLKDAEQKCLECHDLDNSPAFQEQGAFDRYWKKIEH